MWTLEIIGVIIQLMLLISIFDIYKEPLLTSDINYQNDPIADRVIIFLMSGLTPDMVSTSVQELSTNLTLWNKFKINGILKSEAPTTSKNGIIALTSGINEGLLTVIPISRTIDTVFDRVNSSLYFNTENYEKIYLRKNQLKHINYDINFKTNRFNINDETLAKIQLSLNDINNNKIILIHLKQLVEYSKSYDCLFKCVDILVNLFKQINNFEKFIENKFQNQNVYILMSDHGMSEFGEYAGESNKEIQTFFALWGKGIAHRTVKLNQIQIANFISTILGVELPKNSLAITPVDLLINVDNRRLQYKALNALHLSSIAMKSADQIQLFIKLLNYINFEPYKGYMKLIKYEQILKKHVKLNEFNNTEAISDELIRLSLNGVKRMKSVMDYMMIFLINMTSIGWLLMLMFTLISRYHRAEFERSKEAVNSEERVSKRAVSVCITMNSCFLLIAVLAFIFVIAHNWPLQYFLYWLLPMIVWHRTISLIPKFACFKRLFTQETIPIFWFNTIILLVVSELLIWAVEYKVLLFITVILITIYLTARCFYINSAILLLSTVTSGLSLALSVIMPHSMNHINGFLLNISSLIWISSGVIAAFKMRFEFLDYFVTIFALVHHICSLILINIHLIQPNANEHTTAWIQLISALFIPLLGGNLMKNRLKQIALCLSSCYLLFAQNYESLALFILFVMLISWYSIEEKLEMKAQKTSADLVIIFLTLILSSYYLMGNTEDLNFINAKFTNRFAKEDQQHPIFVYILLLIKHCIVLFLIQNVFSVILQKRSESDSLFLVVLLVLNWIGYRYILQCIFWPDLNQISKQLTRHCLIQLNTAFLLATYSLAKIVTNFSIRSQCERISQLTLKYIKEKK
ncbi:hypothetical protein O3M35_008990 [Rhynocoris fuscipes]|uniref:GPI ethanolamine phosphate transferase 1 n=1 Tax=Rhynocoris fuscipes TaxID=488301 RepID=A0AAW1D284_9HEMI